MQQAQVLTEERVLQALLRCEGMPEELPLLVDSPDYQAPAQEEPEFYAPHQEVQAAMSVDDATPADTFMAMQEGLDEYRWKDDCKENLYA